MTTDKLASVLEFYFQYIEVRHSVGVVKHESPVHWVHKYEHLRWMCRQAVDVFLPEGDVRKAATWLGFIQGVLFERGDFTINEMRDHSRS